MIPHPAKMYEYQGIAGSCLSPQDDMSITINGLYLKPATVAPVASGGRRFTRYVILGGDGKPWDLKMNEKQLPSELVSFFMRDALILYLQGKLPRFEKTMILAKEQGLKDASDGSLVHYTVITAEPGKKKTVSKLFHLVPACASCDNLLLMPAKGKHGRSGRYLVQKVDETKAPACPCCKQPVEVVWRDARIIEAELGLADEPARIEHFSPFSITVKGVPRPVQLEPADDEALLNNLITQMPGGVFGPLQLRIQLIPQDIQQCSIWDIFPSPGITPATIPGTAWSMDKALVFPKTMFYIEGLSKEARVEAAAANLSKLGASLAAKRAVKEALHDLQDLASSGKVFDPKHTLGGVYLRMTSTKRGMDYARFYADTCTASGEVASFKVAFPKDKGVPREVNAMCFKAEGLSSLIGAIQQNEGKAFSEVKFFALESTVQYQSGPRHYYLKPIWNEPGKPTRIPKDATPVVACDACNAMLLRFSFDWAMQRDDLALPACPYCHHAPLKVVERQRRIVPVILDFDSKDCKITATNNQIGVKYNGIPVKLTVKVQSMLHFLQNYQAQFQKGVMGPFNVFIGSRVDEVAAREVHFGQVCNEVDWRPVVLYPEDLIAF